MATINPATWSALQSFMDSADFKRMWDTNPFIERLREVYTDSGNETALPIRFKINSRSVASDSDRIRTARGAVDLEKYMRGTLARGITEIVAASMDLKERRDIDRMETEYTGSVYVFNEQQLKDFIREVEDAVKENLAT